MHIGKDKGRIEKHYPFSYRERQGKNRETKAIFIKGERKEKQRNKSHTDKVKNKGRTEKHYPYSYRERQGKYRETKAILIQGKTREGLKNITYIQGKTREELKNITHIHIGKDKGKTEKQKPY